MLVGPSGEVVGNGCLALPVLALPLRGFESILTPYVALTDLAPVQRKSFICGSTNPMFAENAGTVMMLMLLLLHICELMWCMC